jgi:hypothetical protein
MSDIFAGLDNGGNFECESSPAPKAMHGQLTDRDTAVRFMTAGKATVTLVSEKTGTRFTYKISAAESGDTFFVGLLNGPDNEANYAYLGRIARGIFWQGRKVPRAGDIGRDAPSSKAFDWTWRALMRGNLPSQLQIWHEGQCGRCGRKLTVPESIASGFGPECLGKLGR